MATMENLIRRLEPLIESGRIYFGQSTENLGAVLEAESASWKGGSRGERPWGEGPNEDLEVMGAAAQSLVYGVSWPWERIEDFRRRGGSLSLLADVMDLSRSSPYWSNVDAVAEWLLTKPDNIPKTPIGVWRAVQCRDLPMIVCDLAVNLLFCGNLSKRQLAVLAGPLDWFCRRYVVRYGGLNVGLNVSGLPQLADVMLQCDQKFRRPLVLAYSVCGDVVTARQMVANLHWEPQPLRKLEELLSIGNELI